VRFVVSVDMEGVAGVVDPEDVGPGNPEYERNRRYMTDEANAAVRGVLAAEPTASVVVCDSHARFRNLLPDRLERSATLVRGGPRQYGMVTGIDETVAGVLLIGYHGAAGTACSVLAHTVSGGTIAQVRWNGESVGEIGLVAMLGRHFGVPVVLVTGDDSACAEAESVAPGVETVPVKRALGARAAESLHPAEAAARIEAAADTAVAHRRTPAPGTADRPVGIEIDFLRPAQADMASRIPGARRTAALTIAFDAPDAPAAYELVDLVADVAR
jgi:D-amino peptidase